VRGCAWQRLSGGGHASAGTLERLIIQPDHYEGTDTPRVIAPPPLGRMGAKMMELAAHPVAHRSIDFYAALAEVAR
jgi:hypothetical protein